MALVERLYQWLAQTPDPELDRALGVALRQCEDAWRPRVVETLLARQDVGAWVALLGAYAKLSPAARESFREQPELVEEAISKALRSGDDTARRDALRCLLDQPNDRLLFLLPDALRDSQPQIRGLAARALRAAAERLVGGEEAEPQREVAQALREALRSLDFHHHVDLAEAALWHCRELSAEIWKQLNTYRTRLPLIVTERLHEWDKPALARFLLEALTHPSWRTAAAALLSRWQGAAHLTAILRESALLQDDGFREALRSVHRPTWFVGVDRHLAEAPADLRGFAPRWLVSLGLPREERLKLLSVWIDSPDTALQRGAVFAAATLESGDAERLLAGVASRQASLAAFARWFLRGDVAVIAPALAPASDIGAARAPEGQAEVSENEWVRLAWDACRAAEGPARSALLAALVDERVSPRLPLTRRLRSTNVADRLLALEAIAVTKRSATMRGELERLRDDPDSAVRERAKSLLLARSSAPLSRDTRPFNATPLDEDERELLRTLLKKLASEAQVESGAYVAGVCKLLRRALATEAVREAS